VLGPEIWGSGKTRTIRSGSGRQQVLQGGDLYPGSLVYFEFIYPPLSAVLLAIPACSQAALYALLSMLNAGMVDDGAILQRDDGAGRTPGRGCLRCRALRRSPSSPTRSISANPT